MHIREVPNAFGTLTLEGLVSPSTDEKADLELCIIIISLLRVSSLKYSLPLSFDLVCFEHHSQAMRLT